MITTFVAEIRVCQLGAAHDHHIHLVGFQNVLGLLWVVDAAHADGQHSGTLADAGSIVHVEAPGQIQRWHLVLTGGGDDVATGNIQHIHTGILCPVAEGDGILYSQTGLAKAIVLCVDAHEQRHPLRHSGVDGIGQLLQLGDVLVLCNGKEHLGCAEGVDGGDLHDIQGTAAPCTGDMVCNVLFVYKTILGKTSAHGRHDDAVTQSHILDGDGREQLVEHEQPPFESVLSVTSGYHAPAGAVY